MSFHDAGSRFHPHNHCLFDPLTAVREIMERVFKVTQ